MSVNSEVPSIILHFSTPCSATQVNTLLPNTLHTYVCICWTPAVSATWLLVERHLSLLSHWGSAFQTVNGNIIVWAPGLPSSSVFPYWVYDLVGSISSAPSKSPLLHLTSYMLKYITYTSTVLLKLSSSPVSYTKTQHTVFEIFYPLFGTFERFRKATVSFVLSVRQSVHNI